MTAMPVQSRCLRSRVSGSVAAWARAAAASCLLALSAAPASAQVLMKEMPEEARDITVVERVGEKIPLDLPLMNQKGEAVELGQYFNQGKPVVLVLLYYNCPVACPALMGKVRDSLSGLKYVVGRDYNFVVVSFDPTNTTAQASEFATDYLRGYDHRFEPEVEKGWAFHTASGAVSRRLADSVGFGYKYLEATGQYSHPSAWFVLTPDGTVSRYFYGFDFPSQQTRLALLEASEGKISKSLSDAFLLFCYHYDPKRGAYTLAAMRVMQLCSVGVLMALVSMVTALRIGEIRRRRKQGGPQGPVLSGGISSGVVAAGHTA